MEQKRYLIVIGGPTAAGKTSTAIRIAKHFGIEIISADSRQFYQEMSIGTAKPNAEELAQASHHFINNLSIQDSYSVGAYEKEVLEKLEQLFEENKAAILVGGSGLYIRAVCEGLDEFPTVPEAIKKELVEQFEQEGIAPLQASLQELDPAYFAEVDTANPHRLIRALSVIKASGEPFSKFRNQAPKKRPFEIIKIVLEMDREALYDRINKRVDQMLEAGLLEEAKALHPHRHLNALQTVGYEELFNYFEGKTSLEEAIELIKRNSRRYAKRQMTWFRKKQDWQRFSPSDIEGVLKYLQNRFRRELGTSLFKSQK